MDSPDRSRSHGRRGRDDIVDVTGDKIGDDEEWEAGDKRKRRSSKSRKPSSGEEGEGLDGSGRRRSSGDKIEGRKRSSGSSRADSDDDDYDARKELRAKQKKKQEESSLEKLSTWYQDGEIEKGIDGGDKTSRGHGRGDESERRKTGAKLSEHESSRGSRSKEEKSRDEEMEKLVDRESSHLERRESAREKGYGSSESSRNSRRKWEESDAVKKVEDSERVDGRSGKSYDSKYESGRDRSTSRNEASESRNRDLDSNNDKSTKSSSREERKVDAEKGEKGKSKIHSEVFEEDNMSSPVNCEERTIRDKNDKHRREKPPSGRDSADYQERTSNIDDNASTRPSDKSAREVGRVNRSRTPERSGRRRQETESSEMDYDRNLDTTEKELEGVVKEGQRDGRFKNKDDSWSDRKGRDGEGSKESWKRRQPNDNDKDSTGVENTYDRGRDWELPRHGRERNENERSHSRSGGRKDGNRGEAVKTSSKFGYSRENYDVIEIQPKPLDYGRAEPGSSLPRRTDIGQQSDVKLVSNEEEWGYTREDSRDKYTEGGSSIRDPTSFRDESDYNGEKGREKIGGRVSGGASQPHGSQDSGDYGRSSLQVVKGSRTGRGGRGRPTGRDNQQVAIPVPIMGSPFPHLGMPPPGPMQPLNPSMSPAPGPPIPPGVFIPPFSPPVVWPGPRGVDMNMMGIPPGMSPGPSGPRFPPNMSTPPNPGMYYNQAGPGRGPSHMPGTNFNVLGPMGRGAPPEKLPGGWTPARSGGPGRAPSRGEQNDYSQNFVDTGMRPQNFIRELELTNVVEDYPKLRELIQKKDEIVANVASPPMYFKADLREFELSPEFFGTKFDVILIDPPWEEYVHRAPGVADHIEYWKMEEIMNLKIEAIADTPSFLFLWVGDSVGLEQGRQCLKKWGFRRCEDICWVKTNKNNATPGLIHDSHTILQHSKEHCLMGIKGTVRRSTDGHIIHANIDTDVIIAEEPPFGSTQKPEDMYRIIEHFALGKRRLELFGEDHNIRSGWLTVGKGLTSSNFNSEAYTRTFADKDGKVWQGGGGRNPPPDAPHLVKTTPDIEALRPKSPIKNQQQMQQQQQQSAAISLTSGNSSNRRNAGNSPQKQGMHEASSSIASAPGPWVPPMDGFRVQDSVNIAPTGMPFDMYGYAGQPNPEFVNFDPHGSSNLL